MKGALFGMSLWFLKRDLPNKFLSQKTTVLKSIITFSGLPDGFSLCYNSYICPAHQFLTS